MNANQSSQEEADQWLPGNKAGRWEKSALRKTGRMMDVFYIIIISISRVYIANE